MRLDGVEIGELGISPRTRMALYRHHVYWAMQLDQMTDNELMKIQRINIKSVKEIRTCLEAFKARTA